MPETYEEVTDFMHEFMQAGFPGCIGSSDATNMVHQKFFSRLKNHHLREKVVWL
jgi:hypothetical protein